MANSKARSLVDGKVLRHKTLWLICVNPYQHNTHVLERYYICRTHQLIHHTHWRPNKLYIYAHNDTHPLILIIHVYANMFITFFQLHICIQSFSCTSISVVSGGCVDVRTYFIFLYMILDAFGRYDSHMRLAVDFFLIAIENAIMKKKKILKWTES